MDIGDNYVVHFAAFQFEFYSFLLLILSSFITIVQHLRLDIFELA